MSWPTRTWTQNGWQDFKTPKPAAPEGFAPDWEDYVEGLNIRQDDEGEYEKDDWAEDDSDAATFWDVIDNPLYEAAAEASDIDWDEFVAESLAQVGSEEDYEGKTQRWGIDKKEYKDIADQLYTLRDWLRKTVKTHDLQDMPIINRGPQGSDYGIDGDIWEHYGLDQAPGPPTEMDINYEFNLLDARPSTKTYATPAGYPQLDTSTEAPPSPTSYDTYMSDRRAEYEEFHDPNRPATSYGEPVEVPESASTMAQSAGAVAAGVLSTT